MAIPLIKKQKSFYLVRLPRDSAPRNNAKVRFLRRFAPRNNK